MAECTTLYCQTAAAVSLGGVLGKDAMLCGARSAESLMGVLRIWLVVHFLLDRVRFDHRRVRLPLRRALPQLMSPPFPSPSDNLTGADFYFWNSGGQIVGD